MTDLERENSYATTLAEISALPAESRIDALLNFFVDVISAMEPDSVRNLRDQIIERFSTCACSLETSELMVEFINGHLALRELTIGRPDVDGF